MNIGIRKELVVIGALVVILALVFGGWYVYQTYIAPPPPQIEYVLEAVRDGTYAGIVPSLTYEPTLSEGFEGNLEAQDALTAKIEETVSELKKYPYDGNAWMELALHYHVAGDFRAAERVWLFVVETSPTNVTALGNLGRMYHFELKEYVKAEEYMKKAIEVNPDRKEAYFDLLDLYRYSYKTDTTAAVDIMKEGIERFPDDINFLTALGSYYRDTGRPNQARVQFEKALSMAREMGDMNLIQNLTTELSRL